MAFGMSPVIHVTPWAFPSVLSLCETSRNCMKVLDVKVLNQLTMVPQAFSREPSESGYLLHTIALLKVRGSSLTPG